MKEPMVKPELIPKSQRERLAVAVLNGVRDAFEDPKIRQEFAEWQERKAQTEKGEKV